MMKKQNRITILITVALLCVLVIFSTIMVGCNKRDEGRVEAPDVTDDVPEPDDDDDEDKDKEVLDKDDEKDKDEDKDKENEDKEDPGKSRMSPQHQRRQQTRQHQPIQLLPLLQQSQPPLQHRKNQQPLQSQ